MLVRFVRRIGAPLRHGAVHRVGPAALLEIGDSTALAADLKSLRRRVVGPASVGATALTLAAMGIAGCGEQQQPPVYVAINHYLISLAEGNYANACALLAQPAIVSLERNTRVRGSCARVFTRCLPDSALVPKHDQSQLLYTTIDVTRHGPRASADVGGTAVARIVKHVALAERHGHWKLTSAGSGIRTCRVRGQAHHRRHDHRLGHRHGA